MPINLIEAGRREKLAVKAVWQRSPWCPAKPWPQDVLYRNRSSNNTRSMSPSRLTLTAKKRAIMISNTASNALAIYQTPRPKKPRRAKTRITIRIIQRILIATILAQYPSKVKYKQMASALLPFRDGSTE